MGINLKKGQRISLAKEAPGLKKVICGLGWDVAEKTGGGLFGAFSNGEDYDLDASVICLDAGGKVNDLGGVVYFGNLSHASKSVIHLGDNLTGEGDGDDEQILVELDRVPDNIARLVFTVNIYKCIKRKQDFGQVQNAFVRLVNASNNQEIARYNLSGSEYQGATGMVMAEIYRHGSEWKMAAMGNGFKIEGLGDLVKAYS